ncbi:MAG: hypothetical protein M1132_09755 [Chloroflexi bacterium]|nr:hypothetical protein [Chloroflexota bacterium]
MSQELVDVAIVALGFLVRIGIPIAITLALGYWLESKLSPAVEKDEQVELKRPASRGPKVVNYPHCWELRHWDWARCAGCAACRHPDLPCWLALQVEGEKVREDCFTCALYRMQSQVA